MFKFFFLIYKDYLLLWRDKIGLAVLFLMPMFFVFTITLLQSNRAQQTASLPIIIANYDDGDMIKKLKSSLSDQGYGLQELNHPQPAQLNTVKQQVAQGKYKLLIIVPQGMSKQLTVSTQQSVVNTTTQSEPQISLFFDPAINGALKQTIVLRIQTLIQTYQMQVMKNVVQQVLGTTPSEKNTASVLLKIQENTSPNAVQQNIPAWALFGMFFIALPLASIMIKEREQAVAARFHVAPVLKSTLMLSRLFAFISVNFIQLWLMLGIGVFIMPLFHLPALNLSHHIGAIIIIGLFASFAATSFGLLMGVFAKTIEQASAIIPITIVLAAAVGGIMMPTYLMSDTMQTLSALSPLYWGHQAFIDVLIRDYTTTQILLPLSKLGLFSVITCGLAWWRYKI